MRAMVLAAGKGERMLPLTASVPKPAVPVLGRPLLVEILRRLEDAGIESVAVNLHHHPSRIEALVAAAAFPGLKRIFYSREETILGTAGGILRAASFLRGEGTILVRNSDFLADIDLRAALAAHASSGLPATIVLGPARDGYSTVEVDEGGRVLSLGGRPAADPTRVSRRHTFTGMHFIEEEVLDLIPPDGPSDIVRDVYRRLAAEGRLGSYLHDGFWWEFGGPSEYLEGSLILLRMHPDARLGIVESDPVRVEGGALVCAGPGAGLHAGIDLEGGVVVGFASLVGEGCHLQDSVVLPEAWVGPGCRLRRCIVGAGTEVPSGFEAEGALVCPDADPNLPLPPFTIRSGGLLIRLFEAHRP